MQNNNMNKQYNTIQKENDIMNAIMCLSNVIEYNNKLMTDNVQAAIYQAQTQNRKPRRKKVESYIAFSQQSLNLIQTFDDGKSNCLVLSDEACGTPQIFRLKLWGIKMMQEYFVIYFEKASIYIVGEFKKLSERYLYELFVLEGVIFNLHIPQKEISKTLYAAFAHKIVSCTTETYLCVLQGWYNQKFYCYQPEALIGRNCFPPLPLQKKIFPMKMIDADKIEKYFCKLREILDTQVRLIIAVYPFAGILNSILKKKGITANFYINFILDDMLLKRKICWFLQVFSREKLEPIKLDISDKKLNAVLEESNDEVLITDSCCFSQSDYSRKKIRRSLERIANICSGRNDWSGERGIPLCVVLANFSTEYMFGKNVVNIFLHQSEWKHITTEPEIMESVLSSFVSYVEHNYDKIIQQIETVKRNSDFQMFGIVMKLVEGFWQGLKLDFCTELNVPRNFDIGNILYTEQLEVEYVEIAIKLIRESVKNMGVIHKKAAKSCQDIVFNEQYLWMPTAVFKKILEARGMLRYEARFLAELKKEAVLVTDKEGFSKKLQICGNRQEFYQFSREKLSPAGMVDIVDLGGKVHA